MQSQHIHSERHTKPRKQASITVYQDPPIHPFTTACRITPISSTYIQAPSFYASSVKSCQTNLDPPSHSSPANHNSTYETHTFKSNQVFFLSFHFLKRRDPERQNSIPQALRKRYLNLAYDTSSSLSNEQLAHFVLSFLFLCFHMAKRPLQA